MGYRVEHWHEEAVDLLAEGPTDDDPEVMVTAHVARLRSMGASGVVVLLRQGDGAMIRRQALWPAAPMEPAAQPTPG